MSNNKMSCVMFCLLQQSQNVYMLSTHPRHTTPVWRCHLPVIPFTWKKAVLPRKIPRFDGSYHPTPSRSSILTPRPCSMQYSPSDWPSDPLVYYQLPAAAFSEHYRQPTTTASKMPPDPSSQPFLPSITAPSPFLTSIPAPTPTTDSR
jgi:hypothetical protein